MTNSSNSSFSASPVKRTQAATITINGFTINLRIQYNAEFEEYKYNVKCADVAFYAENTAGYTEDYYDAVGSVVALANSFAQRLTRDATPYVAQELSIL